MSQPATITCEGLATQVYTNLETIGGRSTFIESGVHTDSERSLLQLYRTAPKRNGESLGVRKSSIKLTKDQAVDNASGDGTNNMPYILEINMAVPVGITEVERDNLIKVAIDILTETRGGVPSCNVDMADLMLVGEI